MGYSLHLAFKENLTDEVIFGQSFKGSVGKSGGHLGGKHLGKGYSKSKNQGWVLGQPVCPDLREEESGKMGICAGSCFLVWGQGL